MKRWGGVSEVDWAPDGKSLYVGCVTLRGAALLHVDLKGRADLLWQQKGKADTCGRPSPDGRFLAIAAWTPLQSRRSMHQLMETQNEGREKRAAAALAGAAS